jgi:hypothetical protein
MDKAKGHPVRAIFSDDMKDYLKGIELNKIPLEFVTKITVNFVNGNSFTFEPDEIEYKTNDEFIERLAAKLKKFKVNIKTVDFYIDSSKLKTSINVDTDNLFKKVK